MPTIYLAGPIYGLSWREATRWRELVRVNMPENVLILSPLRDLQVSNPDDKLQATYEESPLATQRAITARDRNDIAVSDVVLVNLLGSERVSVGTVMEIGWADMLRKPLVLCMEAGNIHEHPMVREACSWRANNLFAAIAIVRSILGLVPIPGD
jgi:nucleoside 2-deoxyribosyltransferase